MSKIDDMIKNLQEKKRKIDYVEYMKDLIKNDQKCIDFIEVQEDVHKIVIPLFDRLISKLEAEVIGEPKVLVTENATKPQVQAAANAQKVVHNGRADLLTPAEKLSFAMENRHLANKKVAVDGGADGEASGRVVGLDAPSIVVQLDTGGCILVPISKIKIIEER